LTFPELFLNTCLDLFLRLNASELSLDGYERSPHSLLVVEDFEELLLIGGGEVEIESNQIREGSGVVDSLDELIQGLGGDAATGSQFSGPIAQLSVECLKGWVLEAPGREALESDKACSEHPIPPDLVAQRLGALVSLDEELEPAPHPMGLDNAHHSPHRIKNLRRGILGVLTLSDSEKLSVSVECGLDGFHRTRASRRNRHRYSGIDDSVPEWEYWQAETFPHLLDCLASGELGADAQQVRPSSFDVAAL
jgi:hypothetical protein